MAAHLSATGFKIRQLREKADLTQKQIADYLSVDQSLISKIEKGERSISSDILDQMSVLFCCPIAALLSEAPLQPAYEIAFRTASVDHTDLSTLSVINKIALNQLKMDQLGRNCE